jgi:hypothetical protein
MQELRSGKVRKRMKLDGRVFTISENHEWFEKAKESLRSKTWAGISSAVIERALAWQPAMPV